MVATVDNDSGVPDRSTTSVVVPVQSMSEPVRPAVAEATRPVDMRIETDPSTEERLTPSTTPVAADAVTATSGISVRASASTDPEAPATTPTRSGSGRS